MSGLIMGHLAAGAAWLESTIVANALSALVLALLAWGVGHWVRRPAVRHALWLIVLLDLLTPPLLRMEVLPPLDVKAGSPGIEYLETGAGEDQTATATSSPTRRAPVGHTLPFGLLVGLGSLLLGLHALSRTRRFDRMIQHAIPAPAHLTARTQRLARTLGLARTPPVRLTQIAVPPLVWLHKGLRPTLVLPAPLVDRLADDELDAVVAHELAHVARFDPWVRLAELGATTLCWWHPVLWWARSALRRAEEQACDARVITAFPKLTGAYARGLVETVAYLSRHRTPTLSDATTADPRHDLEERLTMILRPTDARPLPRALRLLLCSAAVLVLFILPVRASGPASAAGGSGDDARSHSAKEAKVIEQEARAAEEKTYAEIERARRELEETRIRQEEAVEAQRAKEVEQLERALEKQQRALQQTHEREIVDQQRVAEKMEREATERIEELERTLERQHRDLEAEYARKREALSHELEAHQRALEEKYRKLEAEWAARTEHTAKRGDTKARPGTFEGAEHLRQREHERAVQQEALRMALIERKEQAREQAAALEELVRARQLAAQENLAAREPESQEIARRLARQAAEHAAFAEKIENEQAKVRQQLRDRAAAAAQQLQEAREAGRELSAAEALKLSAAARRDLAGAAAVRPELRRHLSALMERLQSLRARTTSEAEAQSIDDQLQALRAEINGIEP